MLSEARAPIQIRTESGNFAELVLRHARTRPDAVAVAVSAAVPGSATEEITFGELARMAGGYASGLRRAGYRPGDRIAVLTPPSISLYAFLLALLSSGVVAVLIDGRLGARRVLQALSATRPGGVVSVRALLSWWPLVPPLARARRFATDRVVPGVSPFAALLDATGVPPLPTARATDDTAVISFTSGSSGRPKGVDRTHGLLTAQHRALRAVFRDEPDEVNLTCFPMIALHNLCCGIPTVFPPGDLRAPALIDPARTLEVIRERNVTSLCAPPAVLDRLVSHVERTGERTPTLRRILVGGAPASARLLERLLRVFPGVRGEVVYGSTEAEPIASVSMEEVVRGDGAGYLVGAPVHPAEVALLSLPAVIPALDERGIEPYRVPTGECGEVVVRGPHVNRRYFGHPVVERETKLRAPDGNVWHRTGDVARLDDRGRLWLVGRISDAVLHRGRLLHPLELEAAVCGIAGVRGAALVARRRAPEGELALELDSADEAEALGAVRALLEELGLRDLPIRRVGEIPRDERHQSKVDRVRLRRQLGRS